MGNHIAEQIIDSLRAATLPQETMEQIGQASDALEQLRTKMHSVLQDASRNYFEQVQKISEMPKIKLPEFQFPELVLPEFQAIPTIDMSGLRKQLITIYETIDFPELHRAFQERIRELDVFVLILTKMGWTPTLDVTVEDITMWVHAYDRDGFDAIREPLNEFLTEMYDEVVLNAMLGTWRKNSSLHPRMHILERAVQAHIRGEYELSVPVLISQIEGFIADVNHHSGYMKQAKYRQYLLGTSDDDEKISGLVKAFVTNYLLESFDHGDPVPEMSRNAILHGADLCYGTRVNSLKIILLIDWLQSHLPLGEDILET